MSKLYKRVELIANTSIIIVAVLIGIPLVQRFFSAKIARPSSDMAVGVKFSLPGVEWDANGKTLVLALQKGCHFCSESAPFYQRLAQTAATKHVKLIAVLPQPTAESRQYLDQLGVPVTDIRQATLSSINVSGTPTIILVDGQGAVAGAWVGKLPGDKESEVLARL